MSAPIAFLVTYANGHTVIQGGEDVLEQTEFSVSRGFATRRDLDGGAFELTSTEDGRTRRYEPVTKEQPDATRFYEKLSDDGLDWESTGIVPPARPDAGAPDRSTRASATSGTSPVAPWSSSTAPGAARSCATSRWGPDMPEQTMYSVMLASEHKQGLHEDTPHKMCRACHPAEAALLDQLDDDQS